VWWVLIGRIDIWPAQLINAPSTGRKVAYRALWYAWSMPGAATSGYIPVLSFDFSPLIS
jgi:hypothetical protein